MPEDAIPLERGSARGRIRRCAEWLNDRQSSNFRPVVANRPGEIDPSDPPIEAIPSAMTLESKYA